MFRINVCLSTAKGCCIKMIISALKTGSEWKMLFLLVIIRLFQNISKFVSFKVGVVFEMSVFDLQIYLVSLLSSNVKHHCTRLANILHF